MKTLKTKYDFLNQLVEPVRTKAIENTEEVDLITPIHFDDESIVSILRSAFVWSESAEGFDYWIEIHDSLKNGEDIYLAKSKAKLQLKEGDKIVLKSDLIPVQKYNDVLWVEIMKSPSLTVNYVCTNADTFLVCENNMLYGIDMVSHIINDEVINDEVITDRLKHNELEVENDDTRIDYYAGIALSQLMMTSLDIMSIEEICSKAVAIAKGMMNQLNQK
jgi:hypothetical protein